MSRIPANRSKVIGWIKNNLTLKDSFLDTADSSVILSIDDTGVKSFQAGRADFANTLTSLQSNRAYLVSPVRDVVFYNEVKGLGNPTIISNAVDYYNPLNILGSRFSRSSVDATNSDNPLPVAANQTVTYTFEVLANVRHNFWLVTSNDGNWDVKLDGITIGNNSFVTQQNEINFSYTPALSIGIHTISFTNRSSSDNNIIRVKVANAQVVQGSGNLGTLRVYALGNSVTDAAYNPGQVQLVASKGGTHTWGRHMIPGAPLSWLRDHPNDGFKEDPYGYPTNASVNYDWDAIVLQPFDRGVGNSIPTEDSDAGAIRYYINLFKTRSTNAKYYIYQRWQRKSNGMNLDGSNYESIYLSALNAPLGEFAEKRTYFNDLITKVRADNPGQQFWMIPVGDVFNSLNNKMRAGQVPGYNNIFDLYTDGIHLNMVGSYAASLTWVSVLYRTSPIGFTVTPLYGSIPNNVRDIIQQTIYDCVLANPFSGITSFS